MRTLGVFGVAFAVSFLAIACGDDDSNPDDGGTSGSGGKGSGGSPLGDGGVGADSPRAGSGGRGGTAGDAGSGEMGMGGGDYDPEDPFLNDPQPITFTVVGSEEVHPISPLIYGANMDGLACNDSKARFTFCRHRSAAWSTYNWETNASNAGASDCNENNDALSASDVPGAAVTDLIDQSVQVSASTIITMPMLGLAAADKDGGSAAPGCSGDVSASADYLTTRFKQNRLEKGEALSLTPDLTDEYVYGEELLNFLADYAAQSADAKLLFSLDNQMELWNNEHPKLRDTRLSYDEEVQLGVEYARAIKRLVPSAEVLGFAGYGYLAAIDQQGSPEFTERGEFWSYYLREMAAEEEAEGERLIDYVDLHWFSEIYADDERVIGEGSGFQSVLKRVQGTRSFWDPSYVEDSWITQQRNGEAIQLFDWLKGAIDENYPGTKLALSEWGFGGGTHISGAVVVADALGLFGQKGVDLAGVVSFSPDVEPYLIGAFQAFRNYDGEGSTFGDTSVLASSSNVHHGTIYASVDEADPSRMVLVAINRRSGDLTTTLNIDHVASYTTLTPYKIHDGQPEPMADDVIEATSPGSFEFTIPGYSVWVLVPGE